MKKKKIAIIGHFADGKDFFDGQTVLTRVLRDELNSSCCFKGVHKVDTYNYKKRPFALLFSWLRAMFSCRYIMFLLSGNGLKTFCPMIYYANKIFRRKVYHRVIGGSLDSFLQRNPKYIKYLNSFEINWVESNAMVKKLEELGLKNAEQIANFRNITPVVLSDEPTQYAKPFKFCTFSRVSKAKGIGVAIESVAKVNSELGAGIAQLDVYGPIEDGYAEEFTSLCEKHSDCVKYMGTIPSSEAVSVLKDYYIHLFPTTWAGEGFPGTLIDCYNAALPTIASNWAYNSEYIREGDTGFLYDWQNPELLAELIKKSIQSEVDIWRMKEECLKEAEKYKSEVVMEKMLSKILN